MFDLESQTYTLVKKYGTEIVFLGIALFIPVASFFYLQSNTANSTTSEIVFESTSKMESADQKIFIDISGAVMNPDVYEVPKGTRLVAVIKLAGGLTEEADEQYVSKILNKAHILADQDKVYIPTYEETDTDNFTVMSATSTNASPEEESTEGININESSIEQLESLPGIGTVTAEKIADNRPYTSIDDLVTKKVVSTTVFNKIKALITL